MAVSLARHRQYGARVGESKRLAREYEHQQRREAKRGAFSSLLGGVGGKFLGAGITGLLGLTGIGAPLGMALGSMLAKKGAHELTRGMGADTKGLVSQSKYGYGEGEAKTLREGLEEQISASDPTKDPGGFGKQLLKSYVTAGASGALKGTLKDLGKGGEGFFKEGYGIGEEGVSIGDRLKAGWESAGKQFDLKSTFGGEDTEVATDVIPTGGVGDVDTGFTYDDVDIGFTLDDQGNPISEEPIYGGREGGLVPKYNIGGMVQAQAPTISDYFGMQGVSLGGSNKHSLAEMLGRK